MNVMRENFAVAVVNTSQHDIGNGMQRRQVVFRGLLVVKDDGADAVLADHPGQTGKIVPDGFSRSDDVSVQQGAGGKQQRNAAGQHDDQFQFPFDAQILEEAHASPAPL